MMLGRLNTHRWIAAFCLCLFAAPPAVGQSCRLAVTGAACVTAGPATAPRAAPITRIKDTLARGEVISPGTVLPRNQYNILLLADYYGLPAVADGWVYIEVERHVYRVDFRTYRVLELVTDQTAANW